MTRRTTTMLTLLCLSVSFVSTISADEKRPKPKITISKETTFITEPLDADGYPDYVAALNRHCSRGVTPENNAAVLVWRAIGPKSIDADRREQYFKMLGMDPLPEKVEYFWTISEQIELHATPNTKDDPLSAEALWKQTESIFSRPWSRDEFPVWAKWLEVNQKPMQLLTEASKRQRRYNPYLFNEKYKIIDFSLPLTQYRDAARAFAARAMLRINQGKTAEAWEDIMTCHRLARLVGQGPTMVESLVAMTVDGIAHNAEIRLLEHAKLSAAQIASMQQEIDALPRLYDVVEVIGFGERIYTLSGELTAAKMTPAERKKRMIEKEQYSLWRDTISIVEPTLEILGDTELDWDTVLRINNSWFDRLTEAFRKSSRSEQRKAIAEIDNEVQQMKKSLTDVASLKKTSPSDLRRIGSERIAQIGVMSFTSVVSPFTNAVDRTTTKLNLSRLAFALAQYRADHKSYPAKLTDLTPKYLGSIPKDIFNSGADLHYTRKSDGYLLYSVGRNGRDDGGGKTDFDEKTGEYCDDIFVRVPVGDD